MNSKPISVRRNTLTDDEIREYAYHLFGQSGGNPGHDLDHWLEAKACLEANIPRPHSRARLHHLLHYPEECHQGFTMPPSDTLVIREAMARGPVGNVREDLRISQSLVPAPSFQIHLEQ